MPNSSDETGSVLAVAHDSGHNFSKPTFDSITLIAGLGVEGDAHLGKKVQHLYRIKKDPNVPNLRQVHLIHDELHQELNKNGFEITPGDMGENITTRGIDLPSLPQRTILKISKEAEIQAPCETLCRVRTGIGLTRRHQTVLTAGPELLAHLGSSRIFSERPDARPINCPGMP